jgi:hypothetical protein
MTAEPAAHCQAPRRTNTHTHTPDHSPCGKGGDPVQRARSDRRKKAVSSHRDDTLGNRAGECALGKDAHAAQENSNHFLGPQQCLPALAARLVVLHPHHAPLSVRLHRPVQPAVRRLRAHRRSTDTYCANSEAISLQERPRIALTSPMVFWASLTS